MPVTKEFTVLMENRPSIRGRICQALANQEVNVLALVSFPTRGKFVTRFTVHNPDTARAVRNNEKLTDAEEDHPNHNSTSPGEIARLASRLGKVKINIIYVCCGLEPSTNSALVFFGVTDAGKVASVLEWFAAAGKR